MTSISKRKNIFVNFLLKYHHSPTWWYKPVIPAIKEAEAGGSHIQDQTGQLSKTMSQS